MQRFRRGVDLLWIGCFVAVLVRLSLVSAGTTIAGGQAPLTLSEADRRYGLYQADRKLAVARLITRRASTGWLLEQQWRIAKSQLLQLEVALREDLSLREFSLRAELGALPEEARALVQELAGSGDVHLRGDCGDGTPYCSVSGKLGQHAISQRVLVGRGPVLVQAIYPLLARGMLGNKAEVSVFDPLTLGRRTVIFQVVGRESLVRAGRNDLAIRIREQIGEFSSDVWLDREGAVLREDFPFGLRMEFEPDA